MNECTILNILDLLDSNKNPSQISERVFFMFKDNA